MNASRWRDEPMCSSRAVLLGALIQLLCRLPRLSTWAWPGPCAAGDSARPAQGRMVWILGRPHSATRDRRSTGALAAISPASRRGAVNRIAPASSASRERRRPTPVIAIMRRDLPKLAWALRSLPLRRSPSHVWCARHVWKGKPARCVYGLRGASVAGLSVSALRVPGPARDRVS